MQTTSVKVRIEILSCDRKNAKLNVGRFKGLNNNLFYWFVPLIIQLKTMFYNRIVKNMHLKAVVKYSNTSSIIYIRINVSKIS